MKNNRFKFRIWDNHNEQFVENSSSLHCYSNWSIDAFTGEIIDYVGILDGDHGNNYTPNPNPNYYSRKLKIIKNQDTYYNNLPALKILKRKRFMRVIYCN